MKTLNDLKTRPTRYKSRAVLNTKRLKDQKTKQLKAGAVMQKNAEKRRKKQSVSDGPTDRPTDRVGHRVACTRLKIDKGI